MSEMVPDGWKRVGFSRLVKVENGFAFKSSDFVEPSDTTVPIVRMSNLKEGRLDLSESKYVEETVVAGLDRFRLEIGDFVFGMSGSLSSYGWVRESDGVCYQNQRVGRLTPTTSDKKFISYLYLSNRVQSEIELLAAGAAQLNISGKQIENISVLAPPLPEQQKIASVLTSVDEVIGKTQSQINKLQDLKKGTMNELLTRGIGHTEFKETPIGRIPKGWEVKRLDDAVRAKELGTTKRGVGGRNIPLVKMGNLQDGKVVMHHLEMIELTDELSTIILEDGDFLFNTRNTPELVGKVSSYRGKKKVVFDNNILRIKFVDSVNSLFMGYLFNESGFTVSLKRIVSGTTSVAAIYWNDLRKLFIPVPPLPEQQKIACILSSIDTHIAEKQRKLQKIQSLKKSLMQDLLTGKVRVPLH